MRFDLRQAAKLIRWPKNVLKHSPQKFTRMWSGVKRHLPRLVQISQWPQIVNAKNVIGMSVRIEHGIKLNFFPAPARPGKRRGGVDEPFPPAVTQHYRRTSTPVARIGRMADGAVAADRGHAHRCAAPQDRQNCLHQFACISRSYPYAAPALAEDARWHSSLPHRPCAVHSGSSAKIPVPSA